jgi:hypothetical protein
MPSLFTLNVFMKRNVRRHRQLGNSEKAHAGEHGNCPCDLQDDDDDDDDKVVRCGNQVLRLLTYYEVWLCTRIDIWGIDASLDF